MRIAILPLIIIAAALILFVAYMLIYLFFINKKVSSGERNKTHMPESGSVGFTILVVSTIVCFLICFSQISSLKTEVQNLSNNYLNQIIDLQNTIDDLSYDMEQQIKGQNSLFSSAEMEYGDYDKKSHKGEITVTLVPKEIKADTEMTLIAGDKEYIGKRKGNSFVFRVLFDVIEDYENYYAFSATLTSSGVTKTETLEYMSFEYAADSFIPNINATYVFSPDFSSGDSSIVFNSSFGVSISYYGKDPAFTKGRLIFKKNGALVKELDVSSYLRAQTGECDFDIPVNEKFNVTDGDKIELYLEAKDSLGITHTVCAYAGEITEDSVIDCYNETKGSISLSID